jgi:hypothetical protein
MSKKNKDQSPETDPDLLVKIELLTINDKPFFGQATDDELIYIWSKIFKRDFCELYGVTSSKSLTRNVRATYKLKVPTKLHNIVSGANFRYEKYLDDGAVEVITGRVIGHGAVKAAELGEPTKITVKTNFGVEASGVIDWLRIFGEVAPTGDFTINKNTGLKTDTYKTQIVLRKHVPEYLPIFSQKAVVQYAGIPKMCNRCYLIGHMRCDCNNRKRDWIAYVNSLIEEEGIDVKLVGTWTAAISRWKNANCNPEPK